MIDLYQDTATRDKQGWTQDFKPGGGGGAQRKAEKKIQIRIHIVLINYQPRQIPKNYCFLLY